MFKPAKLFVLIAAAIACANAFAGSAPLAAAEYYPVGDLPESMHLPFSEAVKVGDMLYLAGAVGTDKSGKIVSGGISAEAKQTMDNIGATLKRHGSGFNQIVMCTVALADIKEWAAFNDVYRLYFTTHFPARMAFAAAGLALGARVEVQCNAMIGGS